MFLCRCAMWCCRIRCRRIAPTARARCRPVHAAQTWKAGVVLVDRPPVLPCLTYIPGLLLIFEQFRYLPDEGPQSCRRCVGEECEERVDKLRSCGAASLVSGDVFSESGHLAVIVVKQVGRSLYDSAMTDPPRTILGSQVGRFDGRRHVWETNGSGSSRVVGALVLARRVGTAVAPGSSRCGRGGRSCELPTECTIRY